MRAQTVTMELGAGVIEMTSQTLKIASIVSDVAANFRPENVAIPTSDVGFGQVQLRARTVAASTYASLEADDSPNQRNGDMIVYAGHHPPFSHAADVEGRRPMVSTGSEIRRPPGC